MKNKVFGIAMIGMMLLAVLVMGKKQQRMSDSVELVNDTKNTVEAEPQIIEETRVEDGELEIQSEKELKEEGEKFSYYVTCRYVDCAPEQIPPPSERIARKYDYITPLVQLEIPSDRIRENRLNQMLIQEGQKRLPGGTREQWWENVMISIDYRSDRYLCWRYIPMPSLPGECEREDLYFTLDLKKGILVDHSKRDTYWTYWDGGGELHNVMEDSWEETVEEQDMIQSEKGYTLHEIQAECDGIVFPAVKVSGLADKVIEKKINEHLQEGIKAFIENEGWNGDEDDRQEVFGRTKIYISYKSDRFLSVVYSIQMPEQREWEWKEDDEICDLPVVIDIKTGERIMLDDLMDVTGVINSMSINVSWRVSSEHIGELHGLVRTEKENLQDMADKGRAAMESYHSEWRTFYLYRGGLVLLMEVSAYDYELPLPEIHEYLKVDPWYD